MSAHKISGRKLWGAPVLLQDWDQEAEEGAASYWELFLDLLQVAAASAVADQFLDHPNAYGVMEFTVLFMVITNGWMLYAHHITTRFEDSSLAHSMVLFVYLMGFGCCIVNASLEDARAFAAGALLQRLAILVMLGTIAYYLPRSRYFCGALSVVTGLAMVGFCLTFWGHNEHMVIGGLWGAALIEFLSEFILAIVLVGRHLVPINIDHSKERLGAFELIMLGETVLSVTITYRELKEEGHVEDEAPYYWVLGMSFLMVFMFTLLFFHMQPAPSEHAFRRSRRHGVWAFILHKVLALFLLAGGVSIKLVVASVVKDEPFSDFASRLMALSVSGALLTLFCLRYLHYEGRVAIHVAGHELRFGESRVLDSLATMWWWTVGVAWLVPIVGLVTEITLGRPLFAISFYAVLLLILCVVESTYTHIIGNILASQNVRSGGSAFEKVSLLGAHSGTPSSYQGTATRAS